MKILAFVDMHGNKKALKEIKKKAVKADVIVCAGDISIFETGLDLLFLQLNELNKPVLIIPGNHEDDRDLMELSRMFDNIRDINKRKAVIGGHIFLGYEGSGFSIVDKAFAKTGRRFEKELRKNKDRKSILVTHAPPYKTKLDKIYGKACGNKSIRNFIMKAKPELVICGHLHENAGKEDKLGKSRLINPGPFGKIIEI